MRSASILLCLVACSTFIASAAIAGTISKISEAVGPGLDAARLTDPIVSEAPGNDASDPDFSDNFLSYALNFSGTGPVLGTIDVVFEVVPSAGTSEYDVAAAALHNVSGQTWTGMQLLLGTGKGATFTEIDASSGLDFDAADKNSFFFVSSFASLSHGATELVWTDGLLLPGVSSDFWFTVDVPDSLSSFTIRHVPLPEPVSLAGFLVVLAVIRPSCVRH